MSVKEITFRVDNKELFDSLKLTNGRLDGLIERMADVFLVGEPAFKTNVGLAFYGIAVTRISEEGIETFPPEEVFKKSDDPSEEQS